MPTVEGEIDGRSPAETHTSGLSLSGEEAHHSTSERLVLRRELDGNADRSIGGEERLDDGATARGEERGADVVGSHDGRTARRRRSRIARHGFVVHQYSLNAA